MKITFILPHAGQSGGVRVVAIYAARLKARGHQVAVRSTSRAAPMLRHRLGSVIRGRGWPRTPGHGPSPFDTLDVDWRVVDAPLTADDVPDSDVVIATWWETAQWVAEFPLCKGVKVYFMQDYGAHRQTLEQITPTWELPFQMITIAPWLARLISERSGRTATVVMNAVDTTVFTSVAREKRPRPTFGFVASRLPTKGTSIAIRALSMAREIVPNLDVVAFGSEPPSDMPGWARFVTSPCDQSAAEIYGTCDAWLFASEIEGFGLPILEAMACRTPVIATTAGAAPELLASGGGILTGPTDPGRLADAIVAVARMSAGRWRVMSDAAYATATSYSWDDATDLFERALEDAVCADRGVQV